MVAFAVCKVQNISEHLPWYLQIRDLNSGTFGFVELALDKSTGQQVAVKFIERGDKVLSCTAPCVLDPCMHRYDGSAAIPFIALFCLPVDFQAIF